LNLILGVLAGVLMYSGASWVVLSLVKWALLSTVGSSPFAASGTEILLGAILLYVATFYAEDAMAGRR
jgi:hypothetical protein